MDAAEPSSPNVAGIRGLALVLSVALVVRALSLYFDTNLPMFYAVWLDSQVYADAGNAIANGDWTLGHDVLHMSPAYSYFIGIVYALVGRSPWPIHLVQGLLGLITVACVYDASRRLFGPRWGMAGGVIAALYGPFAFYDQQILADGLATVLSAAFLWLLIRSRDAGARTLPWTALGVVWGLGVLTRPNAILLVIVIAMASWTSGGDRRTRIRSFSIALIAGAVTILPVTLRNIVMAGEAVLVTDSGGLNLYIGNGPGAVGIFHTPPGIPTADRPQTMFEIYRKVADAGAGRPLSAREADTYWMRRTWRYVVGHPRHTIRLLVEKLWLFWNAREMSNGEDYSFVRTLNPVLGLPLVQFGWISPMALLGTVVLLKRRREERLVGITNVILCAANVAVFILAHYRIAAVPGLIVAAVGGARWLVEQWRTRRWRPFVVGAVALVPVAALAWTPKLPEPADGQYLRLGDLYQSVGDLRNAEVAYELAVHVNGENVLAQRNLATVADRLGDRERARKHWAEVARLTASTAPDHAP